MPRIGNDWGACDPANPKNKRLRSSLLVERIGAAGRTVVLIDTSPDLREQFLAARVTSLDAVLYTHDHADHTHGIDDVRLLSYMQHRRIDVWADARTLAMLRRKFDYCFETPEGSSYPAIVEGHTIGDYEPVTIGGPGGDLIFQPFWQIHGDINSLGFRVGGLAYSCDLNDLPAQTLPYLRDLDVWVLNTLRYTEHPSHLSLPQSLAWIERVEPKRAILTHLHIELDYDELSSKLPEGVQPAYDGMVLEFPD